MTTQRVRIKKEGNLEKKSRWLGLWRKRWTVLTNHHVSTFKKMKDYRSPTEHIRIDDNTDIAIFIDKNDKDGVLFFIQNLAEKERFLFKAPSKEDRDEWMKCIANANKTENKNDLRSIQQSDDKKMVEETKENIGKQTETETAKNAQKIYPDTNTDDIKQEEIDKSDKIEQPQSIQTQSETDRKEQEYQQPLSQQKEPPNQAKAEKKEPEPEAKQEPQQQQQAKVDEIVKEDQYKEEKQQHDAMKDDLYKEPKQAPEPQQEPHKEEEEVIKEDEYTEKQQNDAVEGEEEGAEDANDEAIQPQELAIAMKEEEKELENEAVSEPQPKTKQAQAIPAAVVDTDIDTEAKESNQENDQNLENQENDASEQETESIVKEEEEKDVNPKESNKENDDKVENQENNASKQETQHSEQAIAMEEEEEPNDANKQQIEEEEKEQQKDVNSNKENDDKVENQQNNASKQEIQHSDQPQSPPQQQPIVMEEEQNDASKQEIAITVEEEEEQQQKPKENDEKVENLHSDQPIVMEQEEKEQQKDVKPKESNKENDEKVENQQNDASQQETENTAKEEEEKEQQKDVNPKESDKENDDKVENLQNNANKQETQHSDQPQSPPQQQPIVMEEQQNEIAIDDNKNEQQPIVIKEEQNDASKQEIATTAEEEKQQKSKESNKENDEKVENQQNNTSKQEIQHSEQQNEIAIDDNKNEQPPQQQPIAIKEEQKEATINNNNEPPQPTANEQAVEEYKQMQATEQPQKPVSEPKQTQQTQPSALSIAIESAVDLPAVDDKLPIANTPIAADYADKTTPRRHQQAKNSGSDDVDVESLTVSSYRSDDDDANAPFSTRWLFNADTMDEDTDNDYTDTTDMLYSSAVLIGAPSSGKTSLFNHLFEQQLPPAHDQKQEAEEEKYIQTDSNRVKEKVYVDVVPFDDDTQEQKDMNEYDGTSMVCAYMDTSGAAAHICNTIAGISVSDIAIILISVQGDAFDTSLQELRQFLRITDIYGIERYICCVSYMDLIDYSQENYDKARAKTGEMMNEIGITSDKIAFIPVDCKHGDNICAVSANDKLLWYKGRTVVDAIKHITAETHRKADKPFVFPVSGVTVAATDEDSIQYIVSGKVEQGTVSKADEVILASTDEVLSVVAMERNGQAMEGAVRGDYVSITVEGGDALDILRGDVLYLSDKDNNLSIKPCKSITASVVAWCDDKIYGGSFEGEICIRSHKSVCQLSKITDAEFLGDKEEGQVVLTVKDGIIATTFTDCQCLGSFVVIHQHKPVLVGKIQSVAY